MNINVFKKAHTIESIRWLDLEYNEYTHIQDEFCIPLMKLEFIYITKVKLDFNALDKIAHKLDSSAFCFIFNATRVPEWFVIKYEHRCNSRASIYMNMDLSEDFYDKREYLITYELMRFRKFSKKFILKHHNKFSISELMAYQRIPMGLIRKNINLIDFYLLSKTQRLSKKFIRDYAESLNWYYIVTYVDKEFIKEHMRYVKRDTLFSSYAKWIANK